MRTIRGVVCIFSLTLASGPMGCAPRTSANTPADGASEQSAKKSEQDPLASAREALRLGKWARAETHLREAEKSQPEVSRRRLAELFLLTGRYEQVAEILASDHTAAAALLRARAARHVGKLDEAFDALSKTAKTSALLDRLRADLLRGELLLEKGQRAAAQPPLLSLVQAANAGKFAALSVEERAEAWGLVGRAAHLLRSPEDANDAFNQSETLAAGDVPLLLARAELFLEKFDFAHAEEVLAEAEKLSPHHPQVLTVKAHLVLESTLAFAEVEDLANEVLKTNPRHTEARFFLAGIALRNLELERAESHVAEGLKVNPRHLQLLSMRAAIHFLAEDPQGFERIVDQVMALSPGYSELFRVVGHYAEWEHRYPDIEKLMRRAVRMDREDGRARALLGLTLVRSGSDAAGILELRRAFELDPFNVRVLNTLDLYEKIIPENYVETTEGPFRFRFPKAEADLLGRYVPALLEDAHAQMQERYDYSPQAPIGIEIYESREQFSVRTSGLPRTAIQGVCFGRKLATMSPLGAPGNLGMTLWHELAHVFHIGLSQNRVPRWLTEGLAEWETKRRDVGWSRELDLDLYRALSSDSLPHLDSMSRAFTHARRFEDVATAYYASGEIASWIVEQKGERSAQQLLAEFGEKRLPDEVVPEVLGAPYAKLDADFRTWAKKSVRRFDSQFVSLDVPETVDQLRPLVAKDDKDVGLRVRLAVASIQEGALPQAKRLLDDVLAQTFDPQAAFFKARLLLAEGKKSAAKQLVSKMISEGHDGYQVRMVLARILVGESQFDAARQHIEAAARHDPRAAEPLSLLASLALEEGDAGAELDALRKWAALSEHDAMVHRRLVTMLIEQEKFSEAVAAGRLAIWVDLAGLETHRLYGLALSKSGDLRGAEYEWESALLCPASPADLSKLARTWKEELVRRGQAGRAAQIEERVTREARMVAPPESP